MYSDTASIQEPVGSLTPLPQLSLEEREMVRCAAFLRCINRKEHKVRREMDAKKIRRKFEIIFDVFSISHQKHA